VGGHATVGGAGFTGRQYGLAIDYITEVEVVLANATIVRASASQHPDLFFAVRGAGASFGIVTEFVFRTVPSPPLTVNYAFAWTATDAPSRAAVFKAWQDWVSSPLPWTLQSTLTVVSTGIVMSGAFFGSLDAFAALNISAAFPPAQQASAELYTDFQQLSQLWAQQIAESGMEAPLYFYSKSLVTRPQTRLPDTAVDRLFAYLAANTTAGGAGASYSWLLEFEAAGGQYNAMPADAMAFPHRDALYILLAQVGGTSSVGPAAVRFVRGLESVVRSGHPDAYYGEYAGYVDVREAPDQAAYHYWGANLPRLRRIKSVLDPLDVFHNPQGVRPL
jgi:FAD/FMN-containing dehydrogenase